MPSIQLSRLRVQISQLLAQVDRPEQFQRALDDFFEKHSERAYRSGETVQPRSLLPSYRVPTLVYRQIETELGAACARTPDLMLLVADAIWTDDHLEPRLLAAYILGQMPPSRTENVSQRLKTWANPGEDRLVLVALLDQGTRALRKYAPERLYESVRSWLENTSLPYQQMGLKALEALIEDPAYDNIPPIFRLLSPMVLSPIPQLLSDLHHCLQALSQKSPGETAYFLHQVIGSSRDPATARLIRRVLPGFPSPFQENLRIALRNRGNP